VRSNSLVDIYRKLRDLLGGLEAPYSVEDAVYASFKDICGGSRARAHSVYGDPFAEDPACPYRPGLYREMGVEVL